MPKLFTLELIVSNREQGGHYEGRSGSVAAALHHAGGELPGHGQPTR